MQRAIYTFLLYLAVPVVLLRLRLRAAKSPGYGERIGERFGRFAVPENFDRSRKTVWIHAVSVGETVAAVPLVKGLLMDHPGLQVVVTTMTPTGSARLRESLGGRVFHVYAPYDLPGAITRFLTALSPAILILMETELWPNIIHHCRQRGIKVVLANARMSARSTRSYLRFKTLTANMTAGIDHIFAQSLMDSVRFQKLGAPKDRISVTGSLKFHVDVSAADRADIPLLHSIRQSGRPVVVAGSTREGEEPKVLEAFRRCLEEYPATLLILVPRHPERFDTVAKLVCDEGFNLLRRSEDESLSGDTQVVIGDSMGEMLAYYSVASLAYVGGSLVDTGCQNVLEPAALGLPVLVGPSQYNFADICREMEEEGALLTVVDVEDLAGRFIDIIGSEYPKEEMGRAGKRLIAQNQSVLPAVLERLNRYLKNQGTPD